MPLLRQLEFVFVSADRSGCHFRVWQAKRLPYNFSIVTILTWRPMRGNYCAHWVQQASPTTFASNGIPVSKQLLVALIIARNSFR